MEESLSTGTQQPKTDFTIRQMSMSDWKQYKAIGLAGGVIFNDTPGAVNIFQMWVSPAARRRGVAMAMLSQIQLWAEKNACSKMALSVNANNEDALTLYKKAGFWAEGKLDVLRPGSTIPIQPMIKKI